VAVIDDLNALYKQQRGEWLAVAPKEIEFCTYLPKPRRGKIVRRLLKGRELGLPGGDLSTLESDER
jgi:acetyl-CoA synthetase